MNALAALLRDFGADNFHPQISASCILPDGLVNLLLFTRSSKCLSPTKPTFWSCWGPGFYDISRMTCTLIAERRISLFQTTMTMLNRKSFLLGFLCGSTFVLVFSQFVFTRRESVPQNFLTVKVPIKANNTAHSRPKRQWHKWHSQSVVRDHPHAGARDENGAWNYVPDVESIRRIALQCIQNDTDSTDPNHYLPLDPQSTVCQEAPGQGFE
jgi:hypothetical protein